MRRLALAAAAIVGVSFACRSRVRPTPAPVYVAAKAEDVKGCRLLGYVDATFALGGERAARDSLLEQTRRLQGNVFLPLGIDRFGMAAVAPDARELGRSAPAVGRDRGAAYECPNVP